MSVYDQSHNERPRNIWTAVAARPFKRAVNVLRNRVNDLVREMNEPAFLDQYPGNSVPYFFNKIYGPFPLTTARRYDDDSNNGFEKLATLVTPGQFSLPRNGNIRVNRDGSFYWTKTSINGYASLNGAPGAGTLAAFGGATAGDIFDSVIDRNGGAHSLNNFFSYVNSSGGTETRPRPSISFDLELYDRKRARRLHDGQLPPQLLTAQSFANKVNSSPIRLDPNTEIEPRLYLREAFVPTLTTDTIFNEAVYAAYVSLTFIGYKVLAV